MSSEPYLVLKPGIARLRGRSNEWKSVLRRLEKHVPDHVSVVGPRYIGKTVFLNAVGEYLTTKHDHFDGCVYWNVGHDTPQTDTEFYRKFGHYASKAISVFDEVIGEDLDQEGVDYERLSDAFAMLEEEQKKTLIIMDGLDHLRYNAELSKNLWDSLRALAEKSSLRFLMASQRPLREICATPEARTSPFWNIFADSTQKLGSFDLERDWEDMLSPFADRNIDLQKGARTEIFNFSGGIPVLASSICKRVWDNVADASSVGNANIVELASGFVERVRSILDDLWEDCDAEEQGVVGYLAEGGSLDAASVPRECLSKLKQRGFIQQSGQTLSVCRPVVEYVNTYRPQATDLRRLFGSIEDYKNNVKTVIELRALQLEATAGVDKQLTEHILSAVGKLDKPYLVVNEIRGFVNRALTLIWDRELPDRKIPDDWVAGWKMEDREGNPPERKPPEGQVPGSAGRQCYLLNLITDPRKSGSTHISRTSYLTIDYLQSVGDFGQHLGDAQVSEGFTSTVTLTAIELCEQLATELA